MTPTEKLAALRALKDAGFPWQIDTARMFELITSICKDAESADKATREEAYLCLKQIEDGVL